MAGALNTGDQGDQGDRGDSGDSGDAPAKRKKWIFMSSHRIPLVALVPLAPLVACMVPMAACDNGESGARQSMTDWVTG
jgi:hypothetical protein